MSPESFEPPGRGFDADADHHDIGLDAAPVIEAHATDALIAVEPCNTDAGPQVDSMVAMQSREHVPEHRAEPAHHRARERFEHRHVEVPTATGRGDLGTDEAGTDHHDPWRVVELGPDRETVVERAQHMDSTERRSVGEDTRVRTGRDDAARIGDHLGVVEGHGSRGRVEVLGATAEPPVDRELLVRLSAQRDLVRLALPREQVLRQRRAIVRKVRLGADDDQPVVVPDAAELFGGAQPCK